MLLIYVDKITERLIYTFDFIFKNRDIAYQLTNDWLYFSSSQDVKFLYSEKHTEDYFQVIPSSLLFEEDIRAHRISKSVYEGFHCLSFGLQTDIIASVFFVLTRYEEYLVQTRDEHDRFMSKNSMQLQHGWIEQAICDRWSVHLLNVLSSKIKLDRKEVNATIDFIPSFDIDNTFAFKWKEGIRGVLGKWRDKLKSDKERLNARKHFENTGQDPYDTFEQIKNLKNKHFKPLLFWLVGDYAAFDKNININDPRHRELIQEMGSFTEIGLHPSYESNKSLFTLRSEKNNLEQILKRPLFCSRQHFLKISYPYTFQNLIETGFTDDYSLGFHDAAGFRAGTAKAHYFFDLSKNKTTNLLLHPFVYMDVALQQYLKLSPDEAKVKIKTLFEEVKNYGGSFIFLWHNETIGGFGIWEKWQSVYNFTLDLYDEI